MNLISWVLRFLIPFVVLFTIGYYVPGFSALTIPWLIALSSIAVLGDWLINRAMGRNVSRWGKGLITFLVNTVVIFFITYGIEGGHVPLRASLLAALLITVLSNLVSFGQLKTT
ncbi:MAG: hypothetical protein GXY86_01555 [Firmicutes bacterium]|nr:hypothetical protein [Bacillota bacterium]